MAANLVDGFTGISLGGCSKLLPAPLERVTFSWILTWCFVSDFTEIMEFEMCPGTNPIYSPEYELVCQDEFQTDKALCLTVHLSIFGALLSE